MKQKQAQRTRVASASAAANSLGFGALRGSRAFALTLFGAIALALLSTSFASAQVTTLAMLDLASAEAPREVASAARPTNPLGVSSTSVRPQMPLTLHWGLREQSLYREQMRARNEAFVARHGLSEGTALQLIEVPIEHVVDEDETVISRERIRLPVMRADNWREQVKQDVGAGRDRGEYTARGFFHRDLTTRVEPQVSSRGQAMNRLARRVGFRHARSIFRSDLKDRYEADPSFRYSEYEKRNEEIWQLGRGNENQAERERDALYEQLRSGVHEGKPRELERNIALIEWGPFSLDDRGGLAVRPNRLFDRDGFATDIEIDPEAKPPGRSLMNGRTYRLDSDFKFTPHVGDLITGDMREFFGKLRGSVRVDFYNPMLQRPYLGAELEASLKPDGQSIVMFNIILYGK
ncbi:MAG: hypothetical protein ACKVX7_19200 [Planctomycetota bacterium]